jgi:hypothetical protein
VWAGDTILDTLLWTSTIPASLAPGNYLIRHELIAVHQANNPQCKRLNVYLFPNLTLHSLPRVLTMGRHRRWNRLTVVQLPRVLPGSLLCQRPWNCIQHRLRRRNEGYYLSHPWACSMERQR